MSSEKRSLIASPLGMTILVGWSFQTILLALFEKSFAADAESLSGAADLVMGGFEGGGDDFALYFLEGSEAGNRAGRAGRCGAHILWKIFGLEKLRPRGSASGMRENHGTLESVAQFTDIAGPGVSGEHAASRITQLPIGA